MTYVPAPLRRLVRDRARERCEYCLFPDAVGFYFETASGRLLYRTPLTPVVRPSPVVDEVTGRDFLVTAYYGGSMNAGSLEMLDTHSGRLLCTIPLGPPGPVWPWTSG